jgi:hypothetical protein
MAGNFTSFRESERGYHLSAKVGKIFSIFSPNPNSGFYLTGGAGYLEHKIKIDVVQNNVSQLIGDYKKGYDRLAGGFCLNETIGYVYLSNTRLLNFFAGIEFSQAWTKPLRDVNFDTGDPDPVQKRYDAFTGIKFTWIIPLFKRQPEKYYYY